MVKFSHLADVHLGGWRDKKLRELNLEAFRKAIDISIKENVDFILLSGDFFDTPQIDLDILDRVSKIIHNVKKLNLPIFIIGGSHDLSLSQKSHLDILDTFEEITLVRPEGLNYRDVFIAGLGGKRSSLEKKEYGNLKYNLDKSKINIFMFHINVKDVTNIGYEGIELNGLPKGFDYYAGGHIHKDIIYEIEKKNFPDEFNSKVVYPGALFPNNFSELKTETSGFYIVEVEKKGINKEVKNSEVRKTIKLQRKNLGIYKKEVIVKDFNEIKPFKAYDELIKEIENRDFDNKIVLLELKGIVDGKVSDVRVNEIVDKAYEKGAYLVLRNTRKLVNKEFNLEQEIDLDYDEIFDELFNKMKPLVDKKKDLELLNKLLNLDLEKKEEEKESDFRERAFKEVNEVFKKFNF